MLLLKMNFTHNMTVKTATESNCEENAAYGVTRDIDILGTPVFLTFQGLIAIEGILSILGNMITLITVHKYEFLWENNACRFIASLGKCTIFVHQPKKGNVIIP